MAKTKQGTCVHCKGIPHWIGGKSSKNANCYLPWEGVIYHQQHQKLDGGCVAQFVSRKYQQMFTKSGKEPSRLFVHVPILNCAKV